MRRYNGHVLVTSSVLMTFYLHQLWLVAECWATGVSLVWQLLSWLVLDFISGNHRRSSVISLLIKWKLEKERRKERKKERERERSMEKLREKVSKKGRHQWRYFFSFIMFSFFFWGRSRVKAIAGTTSVCRQFQFSRWLSVVAQATFLRTLSTLDFLFCC